MNKLLKILIFIITTSFISSHLYASELVRLENKIFDNSIYKPSKNEILELLKKEENNKYWYGLYLGNEKIGWAAIESRTYQSDKFNQPVFEMDGKFNLSVKVSGNDGTSFLSSTKFSLNEIYQAKAPFKLIEHHEKYQIDETESSILAEAQGLNFKIEYKDNEEKNSTEILLENLDYSLYDMLATYAWYANNTKKINDTISYATFSFQELKYILTQDTIEEITKKKVSGVDFTYYKVNSLDRAEIEEENFSIQSLIDQDGLEIKFFIGDFELRLETEKNAKNTELVSDVFVDLGIVVENSFPTDFYDKNSSMVTYEVIGDASSIYKKGNHSYKVLEDGTKILTVGADENQDQFFLMESATIEQRKYYLNDTPSFPHNSKIVKDLSKEVLLEEKNDVEKIFKLSEFVSDYVVDDYENNSLSVFDVIERKIGDCTEHTQLFVNLARAAGMPAREVSGWVYDGTNKFMPHAWAEVAVNTVDQNFLWIPVDPTWNIVNPTNLIKAIENESFLNKFSLKVKKIVYDDGEVIIY
ncbi:transglutaminase-like domain-containing protein [Candidatus Pelagibacter sp.]|nr:transglutaminase-like domain-containing protein [Candidatus Pelagibacter sp.]